MLNRARLALIAGLVLAGSLSALAQETFVACWVEQRVDPISGRSHQVTVCRLVGGDISEIPGDTPPGPILPMLGTDATGSCWFWTSLDSDWVILSIFSDGSAILGLYVDTLLVLDSGEVPRCGSEPDIPEPPIVYAWDAITEYIHDPPDPDLSPPIGWGLAGLETHAGVVVPGPWADTITVPGYSIDVEVVVEALQVDWGDGIVDTLPPDAYPLLTGYPDGAARHVYEVKTCQQPDSAADCHPTLAEYPVTIAYVWAARWRVNGSEWLTVDVPPSETTVGYPVTEAVSVLTGVG